MPKKLLLIVLFGLAMTERIFFDLGPNIELVTVAMVLTAMYVGRIQSLILVAAILIISDLIIGNSSVAIFTWSGFLLPILILGILNNIRGRKALMAGTVAAVGANVFFYLWTNLGVWYLDSWGMYANDMGGLMMSYINALPFLRLQLTSTLVFVPVGIMVIETVRAMSRSTSFQPKVLLRSLAHSL